MGITRAGILLATTACVLALAALVVHKRMPGPPLNVLPAGALTTHYLIDYDYGVDPETGEATMGHLVVLNPGDIDAELTVTVYFEDREPESFTMLAPSRASTETSYERWPVREGENFALEVSSPVPVICQSTIGWNNTGNDYSADATSSSGTRRREAARSHLASTGLARRWFLADGYIIEKPGRTWVRETERAVLLNPGPDPIDVRAKLHSHGGTAEHRLEVPARRVRWVDMADFAPPNQHYGVEFASERPFVAQWIRAVYWAGTDELMTYWSVPLVPLEPLAGD